jgi:hypothetical protein
MGWTAAPSGRTHRPPPSKVVVVGRSRLFGVSNTRLFAHKPTSFFAMGDSMGSTEKCVPPKIGELISRVHLCPRTRLVGDRRRAPWDWRTDSDSCASRRMQRATRPTGYEHEKRKTLQQQDEVFREEFVGGARKVAACRGGGCSTSQRSPPAKCSSRRFTAAAGIPPAAPALGRPCSDGSSSGPLRRND